MIELLDVSKKFRLYRSPLDRVREWIGLSAQPQEFWAVRHVSFTVPGGRTAGIIGPNGAGKSTLLKMITGTLMPTAGTIRTQGRVAALLELGTGFHPEFTGRQNIFINGQLLGLSREEIAAREEAIVRFSELGPFIDQPLRTYSSGMIVRLGFSIAASVDPDLLIVDEALSVGDARFSQKCVAKIREFRDRGTTILFVSHDPGAILALCDEAILLEEGTIRSQGTPRDILEEYNGLLAAKGTGNVEMKIHRVGELEESTARRSGTFQAIIRETTTRNAKGEESELFQPGDVATIRVVVDFVAAIRNPTVGIALQDRLGLDVFGTNTALQGIETGVFEPGDTLTVDFTIPVELGHGDYSITAAVHGDDTHLESCFDWSDRMALLQVRVPGKPTWKGVVRLHPRIETVREQGGQEAVLRSLESVFGGIGATLSMAPQSPSPFLSGFHPPEAADDDWFRWCGESAAFVLRPSGGTLRLQLNNQARAVAGLAELRMSFSTPWEGVFHEETIREQERVELAVPLPAALKGTLAVIEVRCSPPLHPTGDARTLGAAIYAIDASRD